MPCPFAPLLAILPALPFVPWLVGLSVSKKSAQTDSRHKIELPFSSKRIHTFEFYRDKAPHYRKMKAKQHGKVSGAEYLIYDEQTDSKRAEKLSELLGQLRINTASLHNGNLTLIMECSIDTDEAQRQITSIVG